MPNQNRLHPFYMVYVDMDGEIIANHLQPKDTLDILRLLAKGKDLPDSTICDEFNKMTADGRKMEKVSQLLEDAIMSTIVGVYIAVHGCLRLIFLLRHKVFRWKKSWQDLSSKSP